VSINESLRYYDFRTKVDGASIEFERVFRDIPDTGTRRDPFRNLRTGRIELLIKSNDIIKIESIIDLSHLTFLALSLGLSIFLVGWFWDSNLIGMGIFSVTIAVAVFMVGWLSIVFKMDKIINKAVEKTEHEQSMKKL
jgi:hypothetical protein